MHPLPRHGRDLTDPAAALRLGSFRAVLFDLDGTLYSVRQLKLRFALTQPRAAWTARLLGQCRDGLRNAKGTGDLYPALDTCLAGRLGCDPGAARARREEIQGRLWPELAGQVGPYPGLRALLDLLVERDVAIGVVSDDRPDAKLKALGLSAYPWRCAIDLVDLGALKPSPDGFLEGCRRAGAAPEETLYVGDSPRLDAAGARRAGLAVLIRQRLPWPARGAPTFRNYHDLTRRWRDAPRST